MAFEDLLEFVMLERNRQELQVLPEGFYTRIREELFALQERVKDAFDDEAYKQLKNMLRLLDELYTRREAKIARAALAKAKLGVDIIPQEAFQEEEKTFYDELVRLARHTREAILTPQGMSKTPPPQTVPEPTPPPPQEEAIPSAREEEASSEPQPEEHEAVEGRVKLRFTQPVSPFVGDDLEIYGPYEPGDEAELPSSIAQLLLEKGLAEEA